MSQASGNEIGFVLMHGAGLGAWIWQDVQRRLSYPAIAVDFPGRGTDEARSTRKLSLQHYLQSVNDQIESANFQNIILVAHSISGVLSMELAHSLRDRLAGFIAVGAVIPSSRGSFISSLPGANRVFLRIMLSLLGTRPPQSALRNGLCSDLDEPAAMQVMKRFVPESKRLYTDSIKQRGHLPHALYVRLTEDRELGEPVQARMIAHLQPDDIVDLASGHCPMLSRPHELAAILNRYAGKRAG